MKDTNLPKCVLFGQQVMSGAGCMEAQGNELIGCLLDDLRSFIINANQRTTAAHDERE